VVEHSVSFLSTLLYCVRRQKLFMAVFCYSLWTNNVSCGGRFSVFLTFLCEEYDHFSCLWCMYVAEWCLYLYVNDSILFVSSVRSVMWCLMLCSCCKPCTSMLIFSSKWCCNSGTVSNMMLVFAETEYIQRQWLSPNL